MKIIGFLAISLFILVSFSLVRLKGQLKAHKTYWDNLAAQQAPADAITYVALGDSAAQGIGASHPSKGYVGLLADFIATTKKRPVHVVNLSKSGATIKDVIDQQLPELNKLARSKNTVVTIEIGANDAARGTNVLSFTEQAGRLFELLPKQAVVSDIPSFAKTRHKAAEPKILALNTVLRAQAEARGFKLAPLYETTKSRNNWRTNAIDLFHPNDAGYKNWFLAFKDAVEAAVY